MNLYIPPSPLFWHYLLSHHTMPNRNADLEATYAVIKNRSIVLVHILLYIKVHPLLTSRAITILTNDIHPEISHHRERTSGLASQRSWMHPNLPVNFDFSPIRHDELNLEPMEDVPASLGPDFPGQFRKRACHNDQIWDNIQVSNKAERFSNQSNCLGYGIS